MLVKTVIAAAQALTAVTAAGGQWMEWINELETSVPFHYKLMKSFLTKGFEWLNLQSFSSHYWSNSACTRSLIK